MKHPNDWAKHFHEKGLLKSTPDHPVFSWQFQEMISQVQQDAILSPPPPSQVQLCNKEIISAIHQLKP